ncbi:MAG: hypothetical protein ACI89D_000342 [Bermanella sp.]|jgi:hypothetical protein
MSDSPVKAYTYHDGELRQPIIKAINFAGRILTRVGKAWPALNADDIVAAACKQAGSTELGEDSYREPLERYLRAVETDGQLSLFGRQATKSTLTDALTNRIRLAQWHKDNPEARKEVIERPWIIVGLPRTGTSLLSILLGLDPMNRALTHWEGASPIPPPELATAAEDPRISSTARQIDQLHKLVPALQAMHPFGATMAQECVALLMYDLRTIGLETQAHVPEYGKWLASCDMSSAYRQHRMALQALQSAQPTQHWVLKTPNHLWHLPALLKFYPDARIIWTHRDPLDVVPSTVSLINTLRRVFSERSDPLPTANEWREKLFDGLEKGMQFDQSQEDGWCYHLQYTEFTENPEAALKKLYAHFDCDMSDLHARRVRRWMQTRHQSTFGRHKYAIGDFGWSEADLSEQFSDYRARYL